MKLGPEDPRQADKGKVPNTVESYRQAGRIRGDSDARSTRIYAGNYSRDQVLQARTLEAYKKVIDLNTTAILSWIPAAQLLTWERPDD